MKYKFSEVLCAFIPILGDRKVFNAIDIADKIRAHMDFTYRRPDGPSLHGIIAQCTGWKTRESKTDFEDGEQLLVALQVSSYPDSRYAWEYHVITANCDSETPASFTCNGESWGWDWEDVELWLPLSRRIPGVHPAL